LKPRATTALVAPALLLGLACNPIAEKSAAEAVAAQELMPFYGDLFFQATPRLQWGQLLAALEQRLGRPEAVRYAKAEGTEELTLLKEKGSQDFRIVQHQVNSAALLLPEFSGEPPKDAAPPESTSL
jgi:hypothetical protein